MPANSASRVGPSGERLDRPDRGRSGDQQGQGWPCYVDPPHKLRAYGHGSAKKEWIKRDKWHAEQFAYLMRELDSIPEGDGTMLDNTMLLWVQEISKGNTHSHEDMPFVLGGNVADQFRMGRYVSYQSKKYHNDLLATIARAYGLQSNTFGDSRFSNGPLSSMT